MEITGKNILVVGLARTGVAVARFLARNGARVTVTDLRDELALAGFLRGSRVPLVLAAQWLSQWIFGVPLVIGARIDPAQYTSQF